MDNEENKTATINFSYYPTHYPDVDVTFRCDEDLNFSELVDYFRRFALAMSYSPTTVDKLIEEE